MMASMSFPVGESAACSVMDTTLMPLRLSMDLKAMACSRLRVNLENFPDEDYLEWSVGLAALVDHLPELGPVGDAAALGFVHVLAGDGAAVGLGVVLERPQLGGHEQVHVLPVTGHPGVEGRRG